jgi:hypothetical protein
MNVPGLIVAVILIAVVALVIVTHAFLDLGKGDQAKARKIVLRVGSSILAAMIIGVTAGVVIYLAAPDKPLREDATSAVVIIVGLAVFDVVYLYQTMTYKKD